MDDNAQTAGSIVLLTRLAKIVYRRSTEELLGMRLRHFITLSYLRDQAGVPQRQMYDIAPGEPLLAISATGQTSVAVDMALAWRRLHPDNPLVLLCSRDQAREGAPKHSS